MGEGDGRIVLGAKMLAVYWCFFFQAEDGIRDLTVTGVQTCALPIFGRERGTDCLRGPAGCPPGLEILGHDVPGLQRRAEAVDPLELVGQVQLGQLVADRKSVVLGKECRSRWSPYH